MGCRSIGAGEENAAGTGVAGADAGARRGVAVEGEAADGRLGLLLDQLFRLGRAIPVGAQEAALLEAGDEGTNALMSDYIREQEKMVWMYRAYLG